MSSLSDVVSIINFRRELISYSGMAIFIQRHDSYSGMTFTISGCRMCMRVEASIMALSSTIRPRNPTMRPRFGSKLYSILVLLLSTVTKGILITIPSKSNRIAQRLRLRLAVLTLFLPRHRLPTRCYTCSHNARHDCSGSECRVGP